MPSCYLKRTKAELKLTPPLVTAVRGRGFPRHHLLLRPPRRPLALHLPRRGRQDALPGPPFQREPHRERRLRRERLWPPLHAVGGPVAEAVLPVRAGGGRSDEGGGQVHDAQRQGRRAAHLRAGEELCQGRLCDGVSEAGHEVRAHAGRLPLHLLLCAARRRPPMSGQSGGCSALHVCLLYACHSPGPKHETVCKVHR